MPVLFGVQLEEVAEKVEVGLYPMVRPADLECLANLEVPPDFTAFLDVVR